MILECLPPMVAQDLDDRIWQLAGVLSPAAATKQLRKNLETWRAAVEPPGLTRVEEMGPDMAREFERIRRDMKGNA